MSETSDGARPALARWAGEPLAYLTTTGRRSGAPHRIEIWFAVENERVYVLSGGRDQADWVRNLQASPGVTVELGTERLIGVARVLEPGTAEDRRARELLVEKYRRGNELDEWGRSSLPVAIDIASIEKAGPGD